jgi:hypothetical protein
VISDAVISADGLYRYWLLREWDPSKPRMASFMLNPSTADAENPDPTLTRNIGFAKAWGFGGLELTNVYAYRTPSPKVLRAEMQKGVDVVGLSNLQYVTRSFQRCARVMVAWGAAPWAQEQARATLDRVFATAGRLDLYAYRLTKSGAPEHPLYLPSDVAPVPYRRAAVAA